MKNITNTFIILMIAFFVFSCGNKEVQENKNADEPIKSQDIAKKEQDDWAKKSEMIEERKAKKREERKAKGDTFALSYKELQKFLPPTPEGYELDGKMKGRNADMSGMPVSQTECNYKKGTQSIKFILADYNASYDNYAFASGFWTSGLNEDNETQKIESFKLGEDIIGLQTINKKDGEVIIECGIGNRFIFGVTAKGTLDVDFITSLIKTMDLDALSKM